MKLNSMTFSAAAAVLVITGCGAKKPAEVPATENKTIAVEAVVATEQSVVDTVVSSAPIEAVNDVMLVSRSAGTISSAPLKLGQTISKGSVVLAVDDAVQRAAVAQAEVAVAQAELSHNVAKELFEKGNGSKAELIGTQTGLAAAKAGLAMAKLNLSNTKTVSTISGVVTSVESAVKVGGAAAPGTMIGRVVDIANLKQNIFVGEGQVGKIAVGDKATITVAAAGTTLDGKVTAVSSAANQGSGAFAVEISAPNNSSRSVKVGMGGTASIVTKVNSTGIVVASQIITERSGKKLIWLNRGGKAVLVPVTTREISDGKSLVTGGVAVGDTIVTTGLSQLTENGAINVTVGK